MAEEGRLLTSSASEELDAGSMKDALCDSDMAACSEKDECRGGERCESCATGCALIDYNRKCRLMGVNEAAGW